MFVVYCSATRIWDLGLSPFIKDKRIQTFVVCCLGFVVWGLKNGGVRRLGKTRGAIGFALIFLCFVSLYQDKEMKKKDK
jgi:hypothetical protein